MTTVENQKRKISPILGRNNWMNETMNTNPSIKGKYRYMNLN